MVSPTRIAMLDALLRRQETDILLIQEVTYHVLSDFQGCATQCNIGANRRGTAVVAIPAKKFVKIAFLAF